MDRTSSSEALVTATQVAQATGVKLFAIRRAVKDGAFPVYRVGNGRHRFRLSEVFAAIEASRVITAR
jgi:excisionase family DNA binding protein